MVGIEHTRLRLRAVSRPNGLQNLIACPPAVHKQFKEAQTAEIHPRLVRHMLQRESTEQHRRFAGGVGADPLPVPVRFPHQSRLKPADALRDAVLLPRRANQNLPPDAAAGTKGLSGIGHGALPGRPPGIPQKGGKVFLIADQNAGVRIPAARRTDRPAQIRGGRIHAKRLTEIFTAHTVDWKHRSPFSFRPLIPGRISARFHRTHQTDPASKG